MSRKIALMASFVAGVAVSLTLSIGLQDAFAANPKHAGSKVVHKTPPELVSPEEAEVPEPLDADISPDVFKWNELNFLQSIPSNWGTVFSINRVQEGGESYTFWFLASDGTLRGVTTHKFNGPNRGTFFPEVYIIKRKNPDVK